MVSISQRKPILYLSSVGFMPLFQMTTLVDLLPTPRKQIRSKSEYFSDMLAANSDGALGSVEPEVMEMCGVSSSPSVSLSIKIRWDRIHHSLSQSHQLSWNLFLLVHC